jgi:hypothetical protein
MPPQMALVKKQASMNAAAEINLGDLIDSFSEVLENDPGALDSTDPRYVHHLHGADNEDAILRLMRSIQRTRGQQLHYFSGQRGTGKSTELRRLVLDLNGTPQTKAFVVDVLEYISDSHPIETLDLLLITALAFADELHRQQVFGAQEEFLKESVFTRLTQWLQTDVKLTGFTVGGVKAEFFSRQQSVIQQIQAFDLARRERMMAECRQFVRDMAQAVCQHLRVDKVVLVVDSLERLRGTGAHADDMFARVVKVFDSDCDHLRFPEMQVVYSVPPYLPYLSNVEQRVSVHKLASVRVCEPPSKARRAARDSGLDVLEQVVARRFSNWQRLITPLALRRLSLNSGGDLRQLLRRLLLDAMDQAFYAQDRLPLQEDDGILDLVLAKQRVEFESMVVQEEYPLLKSIAEQNKLELPKRSDLPVAARFFDIRAVLNYRNGVEWLDINPLLWPLIDAWRVPENPSVSDAASNIAL